MEILMPDPWIICCAAGVCCEDGSKEQAAALTQLVEGDTGLDPVIVSQVVRSIQKHASIGDKKGRTRQEEFGMDSADAG